MNKNKEWLKAEIKKMGLISTGTILRLIDQLGEPEKPIIPQFVADWIEEKLPKSSVGTNTIENKIYIISRLGYGNGLNTDVLYKYKDYEFNNESNRDLVEYVSNNKVKVINALINGYEVEKEKKYRVVFNKKPDDLILFQTTGKHFLIGDESANDGYWKQHFTEAEIKAIDKRYWVFAEEITEN